jgi:hypothetical protein
MTMSPLSTAHARTRRTDLGMSGSWAAQLAVTFRSELIAAK